MATYEALRQAIDTLIKANGNKEITGDILNNVLNTMLTALSANYQFCGEAKPNTAPGQPLQNVFYFAYEAGTYVNFGGITLPLGISMLKWDGTAWTGENIYTFDAQPLLNSSNLISSGAVFNALIELSDAMHSGKVLAGIADPSTTPDGLTNGQPIFYLATEKGTYSHFFANGDIPLVLEKDGIWILSSGADDDDWNAVCLIEIDSEPQPLSNGLISSKAVFNAIRLFGESFGFGKLYNGIATPTTTPDPLQGRRMFYFATQAGTYEHFFANGDIPLVLPHDGLYAIYSVTGSDDDDWNWEQILQFDDEVISNSHNLPTSMAVYNTLEAFKAEVNALIQEINPTVIEGNVTNAPDEEDLTSVNERLKFKNKEYNSLSASGLGRVYLRKNWVNGVNTLTQEMMNEANTIYHIQYDYVLGEDITVHANCVLEFDGGSISDDGTHTLTGTNTGIQAGLVKIFNTDVTIAGTWNVVEAYPEWFGAKAFGVPTTTPSTIGIQKLFDSPFSNIVFSQGFYYVDSTLSITKIKKITLDSAANWAAKKNGSGESNTENNGCVIWTDQNIDMLHIQIVSNTTAGYELTNFILEGGSFDVSKVNGYNKSVIKFIRGYRTNLRPLVKTTIYGANTYSDNTKCDGIGIEFTFDENATFGCFYGGYFVCTIYGMGIAIKNSITKENGIWLTNITFDCAIDFYKTYAYDFGSCGNSRGIIKGYVQTRNYNNGYMLAGNLGNIVLDFIPWDFNGLLFNDDGMTSNSPYIGEILKNSLNFFKNGEAVIARKERIISVSNINKRTEYKNYIYPIHNSYYCNKEFSFTINGVEQSNKNIFGKYQLIQITNENIENFEAILTIDDIRNNSHSSNYARAIFISSPEGYSNHPKFEYVKLQVYDTNGTLKDEKIYENQNSGYINLELYYIVHNNYYANKYVCTFKKPTGTGTILLKAEIDCENELITQLLYNDMTVGTIDKLPRNWEIGTTLKGFQFFNTDNNKPLYHIGSNVWVDARGVKTTSKTYGTYAQKPSGDDIFVGFQYFNTDTKKMITLGNDSKWYNPDGTEATE